MHDFDNPAFGGYPTSVDDIDRMMHDLARERQRMIQEGSQKPMDAKDEQLVNLAHEAGEMKANYRAQRERADELQKKVERQSVTIGELRSIEVAGAEWKKRAEVAEEKLAKRRKRK